MHSFKDSKNRTWEVSINILTNRQMYDSFGFIPYTKLKKEGWEGYADFLEHPVQFPAALLIFLKSQLKERGVTEEDFALSMDGPPMDLAQKAVRDETLLFFSEEERKSLQEQEKKLQEIAAMGRKVTMAKMNSIDEKEATKILDNLIEKFNRKENTALLPLFSYVVLR